MRCPIFDPKAPAATGRLRAGKPRYRRPARLRSMPLMRQGFTLVDAIEAAPKRRLERVEIRLKVAPLIEACAKNGQADLFRTRSADSALGPIKLNARGFKLEAAEIQNPADTTLQVPDYVLMLHAQDLPGEYGVPVLHELDIAPVITADVVKTVRELLTAGEKLLEIAEAAGHGLAPRVDDLRVGQNEVNEADMAEVVRHLVDEERLPRSQYLRIGDVLLTETPQLLCVQLGQYGRISGSRIFFAASGQPLHEPRNVRELRRPFDQRVGSEYLLEKRGPPAL